MDLETGLSVAVCDADFTSMYPCNMRALNTSRMTMTFSGFAIEGRDHDDTRRYFSNLVNIRENAMSLCFSYHSLPSYTSMAMLMEAELNNDDNTEG